MNPRSIAILQALFVTFLWSTSWVLIKYGLEDVPPLTFAGLRYFFAFLLLLPVTLRQFQRERTKFKLTPADWKRLAVLGVVNFAIAQGTQFVALSLLPAVTLSLLLNFTTIFVAFMGILFLREQPRALQWIGTGLFVAGALLYFSPDILSTGLWNSRSELLGFGVAITCVLANAGSSILGRGVNRERRLSVIAVTITSMGIGSTVLLASGLLLQGLPALRPTSWLIIAWLAMVNTAAAFTLWNHTLRTLTAVESSIINNTMLIQVAILAWIFLGERISALQLGGLLFAAVGALIVQLRRLPNRERGDAGKAALP